MSRARRHGHGHDHSLGAAGGESKNEFKFHVTSSLSGQKPKGASGGNLKPTVAKKGKGRRGAGGVHAETKKPEAKIEAPKKESH